MNRIFAAPWLGHGRATESYLAGVAILYGAILLLLPNAAFDSDATNDIAWWGYGHLLCIPMLTYAVFTTIGLLGNIRAWPFSRTCRFIGATLGVAIWTWYATKFAALGLLATVGFPFSTIAAIFSLRIMGLALIGLPRPGAPGAMGL